MTLTTGPISRALILTRIALSVLMVCGLYLYLSDLPLPWWAVMGLAVSLSLSIVGILLALDSLPEDAGHVRGRR